MVIIKTDVCYAGWGTTTSGGVSATKLQEVEVPVVSNSVCTAAMQTDVRRKIRNNTENYHYFPFISDNRGNVVCWWGVE